MDLSRRTHALDRWMYSGGRPNRLARALNRAWSALFATGLLGRRLTTLEVTGRRTGRTTSLPVVIADLDGERFLVSMLGEHAGWVANVRAAGGHAALRHGGRQAVLLEEVPPADRAPILRRYVAVAPGGRAHIGLEPSAPLSDFAAIADRHPVFRIRPDGA